MAGWFNFALYAIGKLVTTVFSLDLGLGFSLGDFEVALLIIGLVATALIIKTGSFASVSRDGLPKKEHHYTVPYEVWTERWRVPRK